MNLNYNKVSSSLKNLEGWINKNGFKGYDPHDIKGLKLFIYFLRPKHTILIKIIRKPFFYALDYFPLTLRKIFQVKKTTNAKGMALFAKGYLNLFELTGENNYKTKAEECLTWLLNNRSEGFKNNAWGYPFDWQSGVFTPAGTPASVVCNAVGDAFWKAWKVLNNPEYLKVCEGLCDFFLEDLNIDEVAKESICFSYTPLDNLHVHNANLLCAEFLIRIGKAVNNEKYIEFGRKAANYAMEEQNEDGSIYYWGNDQQYHGPNAIDHYHSGFEIRCLYMISELTARIEYKEAYTRYYDFYLKNLLAQDGDFVMPKMTPKSYYPINIHSCAEALILNSSLLKQRSEPNLFLENLASNIIDTMQGPDGAFYYMKRKIGSIIFTDKMPYIRWGQAWMFLAMSEYLLKTSQHNVVNSPNSTLHQAN